MQEWTHLNLACCPGLAHPSPWQAARSHQAPVSILFRSLLNLCFNTASAFLGGAESSRLKFYFLFRFRI